jgi:hypothetical protein
MLFLISNTKKSRVQISPDKHSIIFQSMSNHAQVYWPVSDWYELIGFVEPQLSHSDPEKIGWFKRLLSRFGVNKGEK